MGPLGWVPGALRLLSRALEWVTGALGVSLCLRVGTLGGCMGPSAGSMGWVPVGLGWCLGPWAGSLELWDDLIKQSKGVQGSIPLKIKINYNYINFFFLPIDNLR